ncbi:MAG: PQQ-binding-like beta-propeller repeat protein [Verrucomicrobiota bacterium]
MHKFILTVAFAATILATGLCAAEGEWPSFRGPNHDDKSTDKGLLKEWPADGPAKLWQFSELGKGFSTVSVSGGTVYATGDVEGQLTLFALDAHGKLKWKIVHDKAWDQNYPGARSTPTVDGDVVYLVSGHGLIGCYRTNDGAKVWTRTMQELGGKTPNSGYAESVLIDGQMAVVTPGGAGCITALDKTTGQTIWQSQGFDGPAHYGSCVPFHFNDVPMIAAGTGGGIFCVDARSGAKIFSNPFSAGNWANCPSPAAADGYVLWATGYGKGGICMKLGPTGAEPAWTTKELVCHHGGYLIENGFIYGNHERGVACLDLKTGQRKWFEKGVGKCSITYADGMLFLFGEADGIVGLAPAWPEGFKLTGRFSVQGTGSSCAHPVVTGGRLYLRFDTNLYCFDVKAE